jgi:hypothetical protein
MIFSIVLYESKTWSLILKEEHGLQVFENRVVRRTFGPKRDEIMEGWRKMHNERLRNLTNRIIPTIIGLYNLRTYINRPLFLRFFQPTFIQKTQINGKYVQKK